MAEEEIKTDEIKEQIVPEKKAWSDAEAWKPKTELGRKVKQGEITDIDSILDNGLNILEAGIVDFLIKDLGQELVDLGQSKGKFGGGKRSIWKQTQKKTKESNKPSFSTMVIVGDKNGHVGIGLGKAKETVPAKEKAVRDAKLNIIKIKRGCGSWECGCREAHSIPAKVAGKCGSVIIELYPAPKGSGLVVGRDCKKILALAGIKDVYSKTFGQVRTKINLAQACFEALKMLSKTKIKEDDMKKLGVA